MLSFMKPEKACSLAIAKIGGPAAVGRLFDPPLTSQAVSQWKLIPADRVLTVVAACSGSITAHDARPDVFGPAPVKMAA